MRDPAKVSGRMDKDGQKKKPDLSIRLLIWPMDTPKGGAHNAREPAWPEHNSTPGYGSQGRAAQKKKPLCQGCAAPVGLGLDNAATMGRRTAADGSPGGPAAATQQWGAAARWNSLAPPRSPQRGRRGREGRRGEAAGTEPQRLRTEPTDATPVIEPGAGARKKAAKPPWPPATEQSGPTPAGDGKPTEQRPTDPPPEGGGGSGRSGARNQADPETKQGRPPGRPQRSDGKAGGLRPDPSPRSRKAAHTGRGGARWGRRPGPRAAGPARSGPAQRSGARGDAKWRKRPPGDGAGTDPGPEKGPGPATLEGMGPTKGGPMRDGGPLVGWGPGPLACEICVGPFPSVGGSPFT